MLVTYNICVYLPYHIRYSFFCNALALGFLPTHSSSTLSISSIQNTMHCKNNLKSASIMLHCETYQFIQVYMYSYKCCMYLWAKKLNKNKDKHLLKLPSAIMWIFLHKILLYYRFSSIAFVVGGPARSMKFSNKKKCSKIVFRHNLFRPWLPCHVVQHCYRISWRSLRK